MISIKSKVVLDLLNYFFLHENEGLYVNEIVRRLGIDKRNLLKKLTELENAGLFKAEFKGNLKYYSLNKDFPLYNEYKKIIMKTAGIEAQLRELLAKIRGIKRAFIYGSYVSDKMDASSDIDIVVIGNHKAIEVQKTISALQKKIDREINVINISEKEFLSKKNDPFLSDIIKKDKIELV